MNLRFACLSTLSTPSVIIHWILDTLTIEVSLQWMHITRRLVWPYCTVHQKTLLLGCVTWTCFLWLLYIFLPLLAISGSARPCCDVWDNPGCSCKPLSAGLISPSRRIFILSPLVHDSCPSPDPSASSGCKLGAGWPSFKPKLIRINLTIIFLERMSYVIHLWTSV